jgi:hypothetical protein
MTTVAQQAVSGWYDDGSGRQRWWDGSMWTPHYADQQGQHVVPQMQPVYVGTPSTVVVPKRKMYKTSHGFHLVMSIITLGFWLPVWLIVGIYNASKA